MVNSTLTRNTPTLIGAAYSRRYNWDGRSDSLWAQATGPLESASELGISRGELMHLLITDRQLREEYEHVFGPLNHNIFQHFNGSPCGPQTNSSTAHSVGNDYRKRLNKVQPGYWWVLQNLSLLIRPPLNLLQAGLTTS